MPRAAERCALSAGSVVAGRALGDGDEHSRDDEEPWEQREARKRGHGSVVAEVRRDLVEQVGHVRVNRRPLLGEPAVAPGRTRRNMLR